MKDILTDLLKHTIGIFEVVAINGDKETTINSIDKNRTTVLKGCFDKNIPQFKGEFGIGHLALLAGLLRLSTHKADDTSFQVINHKTTNNPVELTITDAEKQTSKFKFVSKELLPPMVKKVNEPSWDIEISLEKATLQEFTDKASLYSSFEQNFHVTTVDGNLRFNIGEANGTIHSTFVNITKTDVVLPHALYWSLSGFIQLMKIAIEDKESVIKISKVGALEIYCVSDFASYHYIMPSLKQ
jgi:hypothetical protein